jgi:hypothetical protein
MNERNLLSIVHNTEHTATKTSPTAMPYNPPANFSSIKLQWNAHDPIDEARYAK